MKIGQDGQRQVLDAEPLFYIVKADSVNIVHCNWKEQKIGADLEMSKFD